MKTSGDPTFLKQNATFIYPFFLVHMLAFGSAGFYMAYADSAANILELYLFSGFAIFIYIKFYIAIFGLDTVIWVIINSLLGMFGIYAELGWLLSLFGKTASDYSIFIHAIPFIYYILYTFLIRRALLDLTASTENKERTKLVEISYVVISSAVYSAIYFA